MKMANGAVKCKVGKQNVGFSIEMRYCFIQDWNLLYCSIGKWICYTPRVL